MDVTHFGPIQTGTIPVSSINREHRDFSTSDHYGTSGPGFSSTGPPPSANIASQAQFQNPLGYNPRNNNPGPYYEPQARMAKHKFHSKAARLEETKSVDTFIDSGATQHFFLSRGFFLTSETIP